LKKGKTDRKKEEDQEGKEGERKKRVKNYERR